jgi:cytochrome c-type biogenesis protein CcmF
VHAFAQSAIGPLFFSFIGLTFTVSLALLLKRWSSLKSEAYLTSWFSREGLFLLNNFLFMGILIVCFWGVIFPLLSEALGFVGGLIPALSGIFTGQKVTFGPEWYERATSPLFAGLLLLMGLAPLAAWRHSTSKTLGRAVWKPFIVSLVFVILVFVAGVRSLTALLGFWLVAFVTTVTLYEFWRGAEARHRRSGESLPVALAHLAARNRRRYGGYTIHLGVVLMAIGVIGIELFQTQTQGTISVGEQIELGRYAITYDKLNVFDTDDGRNIAQAGVSVYKDGEYVGQLNPRRDYYYESQQPMTIPGIRSSWEDDFYVLLVDWQPVSSQGATFKIYHNPLVNWLWLGGIIFIIGTAVAAWPDKDPESVRVRKTELAKHAYESIG